MLHGGQVLDTLYECPADNQGITGLWSIPIRPADVTSVLVIISFVSGSRAMTAGKNYLSCFPLANTISSRLISLTLHVKYVNRLLTLNV